jgi:hypothetical protein
VGEIAVLMLEAEVTLPEFLAAVTPWHPTTTPKLNTAMTELNARKN